MDIGSLIAAALLSIGLIGADAVINAGNVLFQVGVTRKLVDQGYTPAVVDRLLDNDLKEIVEFRSIVHRTRIRSAEEKSVVGSIGESLGLRDVTSAFQAEFGFDSIRLTGSLMEGTTGEFRFILGGQSLHTGKFTIDVTSKDQQPLPEFLRGVARNIAEHLEPYAVAVEKFHVLQRKNSYQDDDADHAEFVKYIKQQISQDDVEGEGIENDQAAFYNLLGMASLLYHEHDCAAHQFQRAATIDPDLGVPELNLALLSLIQQHFDDAMRQAAQAAQARDVAREPLLLGNAHTIMGLALWAKGDLAGAAQHFRQGATLYPGSMWAYFYWGQLQKSLGNEDSAAFLFGRAERNLALFESYPEVALMYIRIDPKNGFHFSRVDIARTRHLEDLEPNKKEETEGKVIAAMPHACMAED
jgi:tetratricopeptide (TPR) repeat protein